MIQFIVTELESKKIVCKHHIQWLYDYTSGCIPPVNELMGFTKENLHRLEAQENLEDYKKYLIEQINKVKEWSDLKKISVESINSNLKYYFLELQHFLHMYAESKVHLYHIELKV